MEIHANISTFHGWKCHTLLPCSAWDTWYRKPVICDRVWVHSLWKCNLWGNAFCSSYLIKGKDYKQMLIQPFVIQNELCLHYFMHFMHSFWFKRFRREGGPARRKGSPVEDHYQNPDRKMQAQSSQCPATRFRLTTTKVYDNTDHRLVNQLLNTAFQMLW